MAKFAKHSTVAFQIRNDPSLLMIKMENLILNRNIKILFNLNSVVRPCRRSRKILGIGNPWEKKKLIYIRDPYLSRTGIEQVDAQE